MKKLLILVIGVLFIGIVGWIFFNKLTKASASALPTYFSYRNEQLSQLGGLRPKGEITSEDLYKWDQITFDLISKNSLTTGFDPNTANVYAYLTTAQRDAAFLSYNRTSSFGGDIGVVSSKVLCLFFPGDCDRVTKMAGNDEFSERVAQVVLENVKTRLIQDKAGMHPYPAKIGSQYWNGPEPRIGIMDGSRKPWFIRSGSQFRVPPPPAFGSQELQTQLGITKTALAQATAKQKQAVVFWAGGPGTKTPPGIWLDIADTYMQDTHVPVQKMLLARSILSIAMADSVIAVFDSKYTYWVKRPFMLDPSIITIMPTPNHPSYPAGHSTLSATARVILTFFFPEATEKWQTLATEAGLSRVWGGIHYSMDNEQGNTLGQQVGEEVLRHNK